MVLGVVVAMAAKNAGKRYEIAFDVQKYYSCLHFDVFLIDRKAAGEIKRGDLVKFKAPENERFNGQFEVVKIAAGVAGDTWKISKDRLFINGDFWGYLHLMKSLGIGSGELDGTGVIPEGRLYVLGTTPSSYDSRYWGSIEMSNVKGKAHVVL